MFWIRLRRNNFDLFCNRLLSRFLVNSATPGDHTSELSELRGGLHDVGRIFGMDITTRVEFFQGGLRGGEHSRPAISGRGPLRHRAHFPPSHFSQFSFIYLAPFLRSRIRRNIRKGGKIEKERKLN